MTREELIKAFEMRVDGYTYKEIGEEIGYTHSNICDELKNVLCTKKVSIKNTIYPNLKREIILRYRNLTNFCEATGMKYRHLYDVLRGNVQANIDDVLICCKYLKNDSTYLFENGG